jgi:lactoylglutathione lyase
MRATARLLALVGMATTFEIVAPSTGVFARGDARVEGVAHIAYYVSDLARARAYYEDFLGFDEAFALKQMDGADHVVFIKINDRQFIELLADPPKNHGYLYDAAFWTRDVAGVRASLAARGVAVSAVGDDLAGDLSCNLIDPFGFDIQIVQYVPDSRTGRTAGKAVPATRISDHIDHVGLLLGDRDAGAKFYGEMLGFTTEGDGSKQRVGEGPDRFELGFERKPPTPDRFHVKNHICLSVPDVPSVAAALRAKPAARSYREIETHVLDNGKHVAELYDLDGNRVELMEPPKQK